MEGPVIESATFGQGRTLYASAEKNKLLVQCVPSYSFWSKRLEVVGIPISSRAVVQGARRRDRLDAIVEEIREAGGRAHAVMRKIVHVDMDAFYASVEQRDNTALRGRPVIVAWQGKRSVVCAASYEARKFGVRSEMPAVMAERLCPDAVFVPPDFVRYKAVSQAVREIFQRHTELIEPLSLDEAYLDVTENKSGLPTATLVAKTIRQQIAQELNLTASAGIAPNKFTDGWCLSIVDAQVPFAKLWKAYGVGVGQSRILTDERG